MIDKSRYHRIIQVGTINELITALRDITECKLSSRKLHRNVLAWLATNKQSRSTAQPAYRFAHRFFVKLWLMPSFAINVRESLTEIRKTCYGFRHKRTGERIYLRIDPGSLVVFRTHVVGYVLGQRYIIPGIDRIRHPVRWDKVERRMTEYLARAGLKIKRGDVRSYYSSFNARYKLARKLLILKLNRLKKDGELNGDQHSEALNLVP